MSSGPPKNIRLAIRSCATSRRKRRSHPPYAPLDDYLEWAQQNGFERFVFVQPSAYARDNSCMLDAMKAIPHACRGIVDVDEDAPDSLLAEMHKAGVRGVRINV